MCGKRKTKTNKTSGDENVIRGNWSSKLDGMLLLIGYSVGLGNVWRFPYLCYRNGGGAFLLPYFTMLFIAGLPLFFMELAIGQYASLGPIAVWKLCPPFKGLGLAAATITGLLNVYYNTLLAYILFYLFASMTSQLPWTTCDHSWNTPACSVRKTIESGSGNFTYNATDEGSTSEATLTSASATLSGVLNASLATSNLTRPKTPAEEYFERYVLDLSSGIDDLGNIRWQLLLCYLLAWIIVFLCLIKGIKSAGKVVYFTALFPYVVLTILLVRGLTLEGSWGGVKYFLIPQWHMLLKAKVWGDAATQIFYSLGPAWGGLIAFASYNKFHGNCQRDALICSLVCAGTSLFAGFVIFAVIGFMAHELKVDIGDVMASGPGLAFVAYPEAISRMPVAPFWSIIFFCMLLCVGLDTVFATVEMVVTALTDEFLLLRKHKTLFTLGICMCYFVIGLPQITRGGMYILNLIDWYFAAFSLLIVAILESVVIVYLYGYSNFAKNVQVMTGVSPNIFYRVCWFGLTPLALLSICVFNGIMRTRATYNDYVYPAWADGIGWIIAVLPVLWIPGYMIYYYGSIVGSYQNFLAILSPPWTGRTLRDYLRPDSEWGPMMPLHRQEAGLAPLLGTDEIKNAWKDSHERGPPPKDIMLNSMPDSTIGTPV